MKDLRNFALVRCIYTSAVGRGVTPGPIENA